MTDFWPKRLIRLKIASAFAALSLSIGAASLFAQTAAQRIALQHIGSTGKANQVDSRPRAAQAAEAANSSLSSPSGVAYDSSGNLYIADTGDHTVREVTPLGIITTVAGTGEQGFGGDGGDATSAMLDSPAGVAVDAAGNIYIADSHNHRIRRVTAGAIATIAGTGAAGFSGDGGAATAAMLNLPTALAVDASGSVYVADTNNHRIRRITNSLIATVAGDGDQIYSGDGAAATQAGLDSPNGVAVDAAGNVFIGDTHNQRVREVAAATGLISTVAGNGAAGFSGDGAAGITATMVHPRGVAVAASGELYIADSDNNRIRSVKPGGTITTVAGDGEQGFAGDTGPATSAIFNTPKAVALNSSDTVAIADTGNQRVRELLASNSETVAGVGVPGALALLLSAPTTVVAGNGSITATLSNASVGSTGTVTFLDVTNGAVALGTAPIAGNSGTFSLASVSAGAHLFAARFQSDANVPVVTSGVVGVDIISTDFTISAAPATATVVPGATANFAISLVAAGSTFGSDISLTASGLPAGATATFTPSSIAAGAPKSATATLTIQTAALNARRGAAVSPSGLPAALSLVCLPLFLNRRLRKVFGDSGVEARLRLLVPCLLLVGALFLTGCGSGINPNAHPPKSYIVTVTGTSAGAGSTPAIAHSTTVTLTIE